MVLVVQQEMKQLTVLKLQLVAVFNAHSYYYTLVLTQWLPHDFRVQTHVTSHFRAF